MERQIVSGFTCMEVDRIFTHKDQPELIPILKRLPSVIT